MPKRIMFMTGKYHSDAAGPTKPRRRMASAIGTEMNSRRMAMLKQR
jgi:hypothetical protein